MGLACTWRVGLAVKLFVCVQCMEMNSERHANMTRSVMLIRQSSNLVFSGISLMTIFSGDHPARALMCSALMLLAKISWYEIECQLLLITNRKSHMGFRLVPKSMTLNDLERHNGHVVCIILLNSVAFCDYYVKVVEDTPIHTASEM